jgi:hypothetical protein
MTISWLIFGDRSVASSRLQGYLIHEGLCRLGDAGLRSRLAYAPPFVVRDPPWHPSASRALARASRGGVVVLQKVSGPRTGRLVEALAAAGVATVYVHCDHEPKVVEPLACDAVVCPSEELAAYYRERGARRVELIPDPAEFDWPAPAPPRDRTRGLRVGWVGNAVNWPTLDPLRAILAEDEFRDLELVTISDHPEATMPWSLEAVRRELPGFDLAALPTGTGDVFRVKSSNRAVLFMAAGVPVVAGRIRAYESLIDHGRDGLLAADAEGFRRALRTLRDPAARGRIGEAGYRLCRERYHLDRIVGLWAELLRDVARRKYGPGASRPRDAGRALDRLASHSALRLVEVARRRGRPDDAGRLLREGLALGLRAPGPLFLRDLAHLARGAARVLARRATPPPARPATAAARRG